VSESSCGEPRKRQLKTNDWHMGARSEAFCVAAVAMAAAAAAVAVVAVVVVVVVGRLGTWWW
jgi:hypothetical protein